jgi:hypothetical protein
LTVATGRRGERPGITEGALLFRGFTEGQRWEEFVRDRSIPWKYSLMHTEADLPHPLAWAKTADEACKRGL